jgi:hypothetical protein
MTDERRRLAVRRPEAGLIGPALRWVLILATAGLLMPPGFAISPGAFELILFSAFILSNIALMALPRPLRVSSTLDYGLVIADTFLVSTGLFHAGLDGGRFATVFFMILLVSAVGPDLVQLVAGASLVAGIYIYLVAGSSGVADP